MTVAQHDAKMTLDTHAQAIEALHEKLAAMPGADKTRLQDAVNKYKAAYAKFTDDALGCMN